MPSTLSRRPGKITSITRTAQGIDASTENGQFNVQFYSDRIARIQVTLSDQFDSYPYAVQASPLKVVWEFDDQPDSLELRTKALVVRILKNPLAFVFLNSSGRVLTEEIQSLGTSWIGEQVTSYRKLQDGERFIGLGEKTGPLDRRGHGYQNWNTDAFSYSLGEDPLYCSTPFFIGLHHGVQYGVFFDNTYKTFFNFGASNNRFSSIAADAGDMNYYLIQGDSIGEILQGYGQLTGLMPLPPKWSIGYQQCRYSYYPDSEVRTIANTFRDKKIPADGIVLDIHHMDGYKIFTWDPKNFPDPKKLVDDLRARNFEVVLMCDPGIKIEQGYDPYDDGVKNDVFLKYPDNEYYAGQVWPGWCHFPDFTNPKVREWWKNKLTAYASLGVDGFWNDMNEIATWGGMQPDNIEFDYEGDRATSRKARNVYGLLMARSSYEAAKSLLSGKRPFNLTRSGFSGVQRYAAVWTGDNVSYDDHMLLGVRMINCMGLTGIPFVGYDVGGFAGEANVRLFARWITLGALSPFFRGHTMVNSPDAEPWAFGEEVEHISRNFIRFRYQLMPYLYSVFEEASRTGMPVQRSMAITYPHEGWVYDKQFHNQYFFGPFILVAPATSHQEYEKLHLPDGEWYALYEGKLVQGNQDIIVECPLHKLPIYIQAGAVIPMQRPVMHTKERVTELILHVYAGKTDVSFDYYEDDGSTFQYEQGHFCRRALIHHASQKSLTIGKQTGTYDAGFDTIRIILHGTNPDCIRMNGKSIPTQSLSHSYFLPLEKYDPIHDPESMGNEDAAEVVLPWSADEIEIHW